jgi:hypothetical protein
MSRKSAENVRDIRGTTKEGMADDALWDMVQQEKRSLITTDKRSAQCRAEYHQVSSLTCLFTSITKAYA